MLWCISKVTPPVRIKILKILLSECSFSAGRVFNIYDLGTRLSLQLSFC